MSLGGGPRPGSTASSYSPSHNAAPLDPQAITYSYITPPNIAQGRSSPNSPELTAPVPTKDTLLAAQKTLPPNFGPSHLPWIRDVLFYIEHDHTPNESGIIILTDLQVRDLAVAAATALLHILSVPPPHPAEAIYLRGLFHANGCVPDKFEKSPRNAFRDFEASARAGWVKGWFKIGREYENTGDVVRARDCFERGMKGGVESCYYRMGMARLLGQLGQPPSPDAAMQLLHKAASISSVESPHPAYVYGLLLLGEFTAAKVDDRNIVALIPQGSSPTAEARKHIERAAYLGFAPAQYKLGHAYEYAVPPFPSDPLLSVQYYSLASQQGEAEADMALSKWFLCGADGFFEKDEGLAVTFADKAAKKSLHSAEFAMGYYAEVGIGGPKDFETAKKWYARAVEHGNGDAPARLEALSGVVPLALSRTQHDDITNDKLVRRRTQAKADAIAAGRVSEGRTGGGPTPAERVKMEAMKVGGALGPPAGSSQSSQYSQQGPPSQGLPQSPYPSQGPPPSQYPPQVPQQQQQPYPPQQQQQQQPYPPQQQQQQPYPPQQQQQAPPQHPPSHHANTLPPTPNATAPLVPGGSGPGQARPYNPSAPRYTLTDSPSPHPSQSPHPSHQSSVGGGGGITGGRQAGKPPGRRHETAAAGMQQGPPPSSFGGPPPAQSPSQGGPPPPATFEEMGFAVGKAEEKDCVIM
ncbi:hypothetical protein M422DRAFT_186581 [Sphaerobolus stellatus SS14]|uniref:HCP-like protein n=1 Tax=Sphaerobolus stellatus (strain SS14) TaxID=990650 RepID=A0A0C9U8T2_SPHS4|nr:hypothetical protein M422DRAFT_186581 [Sphaerobolus stellatus SS14]